MNNNIQKSILLSPELIKLIQQRANQTTNGDFSKAAGIILKKEFIEN